MVTILNFTKRTCMTEIRKSNIRREFWRAFQCPGFGFWKLPNGETGNRPERIGVIMVPEPAGFSSTGNSEFFNNKSLAKLRSKMV